MTNTTKLRRYRKLFSRLPKHIMLDMVFRDLDLEDPNACVCGWALRLALQNGVLAEHITLTANTCSCSSCQEAVRQRLSLEPGELLVATPTIPMAMARRFGGSLAAWEDLFTGVVDPVDAPLIEQAFVERVAACCR